MQVAIAFHHNANDMDVIYFDDLFVYEGAPMLTSITNSDEAVAVSVNYNTETENLTIVNPTNNLLTVKLIDVTGRMVASIPTHGADKIDLKKYNLNQGVYIVTVSGQNISKNKRIYIK